MNRTALYTQLLLGVPPLLPFPTPEFPAAHTPSVPSLEPYLPFPAPGLNTPCSKSKKLSSPSGVDSLLSFWDLLQLGQLVRNLEAKPLSRGRWGRWYNKGCGFWSQINQHWNLTLNLPASGHDLPSPSFHYLLVNMRKAKPLSWGECVAQHKKTRKAAGVDISSCLNSASCHPSMTKSWLFYWNHCPPQSAWFQQADCLLCVWAVGGEGDARIRLFGISVTGEEMGTWLVRANENWPRNFSRYHWNGSFLFSRAVEKTRQELRQWSRLTEKEGFMREGGQNVPDNVGYLDPAVTMWSQLFRCRRWQILWLFPLWIGYCHGLKCVLPKFIC